MQFTENNGSQQNSFICSDHFHESCFVIRPGAEGRRLKDDAVPSIFHPIIRKTSSSKDLLEKGSMLLMKEKNSQSQRSC